MITLNLNPDHTVTWSDGQPAQPIPQPMPQRTPQPIPNPPGSALRWDLHPVQLWPVPPMIGSGDTGICIQFIADSVTFPDGVQIGVVDEFRGDATSPATSKEVVISASPFNFTPVSPLAYLPGVGSSGGPIYCRFGPARKRIVFGQEQPSLDVPLTPGAAYYINVREYKSPGDSSPRGNVHCQFVCQNRTGGE